MAWDHTAPHWGLITAAAGALAAVGITRPWRFLRARNSCPQCKKLLPRWDCWGWKEAWTCGRCGCRVGG